MVVETYFGKLISSTNRQMEMSVRMFRGTWSSQHARSIRISPVLDGMLPQRKDWLITATISGYRNTLRPLL